MCVSKSPLRYKRLISALPKHNYKVRPAAIEAGFTENTADSQGKRLLKSALKYQAQEIINQLDNKPSPSSKQLMREIVGLSKEDVMERLKYIAFQEKDLNSALKVLAPLAKQEGVILQNEDENKVNVPILNVVVKEKQENMAQQSDIIKL
jgi:phage terminase small subunit